MQGINTVNNRRPKLPKAVRQAIKRVVKRFVYMGFAFLAAYAVWDTYSNLKAAGGLRDWTTAFGFRPSRRIL